MIVVLSALLILSIGWNAWNLLRARNRRAEALAEAQAAQAKFAFANAEAARIQRREREAHTAARVQQLYDEINNLTQVGEKLSVPSEKTKGPAPPGSSEDKTAPVPDEPQ
jgi:hypothetical protein